MSGKRHPVTGSLQDTPAVPGAGWPEDPADARTPVARTAGGVRRLAARADLGTLRARISVCRACPRLVEWRERAAHEPRPAYADQPYWGRPVPSFGDPAAALLVVGLAPAAHGGNRTGRNFTGDRSATWLFKALHHAGLAALPDSEHAGDGQRLHGVRLLNPVRCAPPDNKPSVSERETCAPWLRRELELLRPGVRSVLCLGAIGWAAAWGALASVGLDVPRPRPAFGHGAEVLVDDVRVFGCYHPSPHNTATGRLTEAMFADVLGRAAAAAGLRDTRR